jgi:hypothetical protein
VAFAFNAQRKRTPGKSSRLVRPKLSSHTELDGYSKGHSEIKTAMNQKIGKTKNTRIQKMTTFYYTSRNPREIETRKKRCPIGTGSRKRPKMPYP